MIFKTTAFRERSPGLLPILKLFSRNGLRLSVFGNRERFQVTLRSTSWCEHKWHNLIHYVRRWKPEKLRCGRVPSVAPKNNDFQDSLSWRVAPVKKRDVWSGDPDVNFIDMACQAVLLAWWYFTGFWSGGLLGHDVFKRFGKMIWERGNRLKTGIELWKGFIKSLWF